MTENSQHSISEKFHKENDPLRIKREASSTANGLSESSNPLQEEEKKSIQSIRSSRRKSSRKNSLNECSVLENLKFHRKQSIEIENNNKPSIKTKPFSDTRNSKFKIRLPGDSSKHLSYHKENLPVEITPEHITEFKESNKEEKFISGSCKEKTNGKEKESENDRRKENDRTYESVVGKELVKEFDEESEILDLNSEDEDKKSEDLFVHQEVVYLIRIHLAPILGPSLEMPARMESFQVNIEYECTGIEKVLISALLEISEIEDEIIEKNDEEIKKSEKVIICTQEHHVQKQENKTNQHPNTHNIDQTNAKISQCRTLSISRPNDAQDKERVSVGSEENVPKGQVLKKPNLQQIGNIYDLKICPSEFIEKTEKPRLLSESLESNHINHRIFKSHPFLDKALKNRNKILPKNMSDEKENHLSIPENRSGEKTRQMESDQLKAKRIIKKRNINELKLKEIIQEAKNQVMVECKEMEI